MGLCRAIMLSDSGRCWRYFGAVHISGTLVICRVLNIPRYADKGGMTKESMLPHSLRV